MKVKILAFGIVKDIFQAPEEELEIPEGSDVKALKAVLEDRFPDLKRLKAYFIALDDAYAEEGDIVDESQEIAVIPPVSGG